LRQSHSSCRPSDLDDDLKPMWCSLSRLIIFQLTITDASACTEANSR
jgi:hypothetical protein